MGRNRPVFCVLAALFALGASAAEPAPALVVPTLAGPDFDLSAQRGHVVIVNFWASWCVPCRAEMPVLDQYFRKHRTEGLSMIGVSLDTPAALPAVERAAAKVAYPVALADRAGKNGFPPVNALPVTYVVDARGEVRARLVPGEAGLTEQALAAAVDPLLKAARP